jgi:hypothetical protein
VPPWRWGPPAPLLRLRGPGRAMDADWSSSVAARGARRPAGISWPPARRAEAAQARRPVRGSKKSWEVRSRSGLRRVLGLSRERENKVGERRATDMPPSDPEGLGIISAVPPAPFHTVRAVLPHTAFPRAVGETRSALPRRWRITQAVGVPDRGSWEPPQVGDRSPSSPLTLGAPPPHPATGALLGAGCVVRARHRSYRLR